MPLSAAGFRIGFEIGLPRLRQRRVLVERRLRRCQHGVKPLQGTVDIGQVHESYSFSGTAFV
jgi:hypothetical protein